MSESSFQESCRYHYFIVGVVRGSSGISCSQIEYIPPSYGMVGDVVIQCRHMHARPICDLPSLVLRWRVEAVSGSFLLVDYTGHKEGGGAGNDVYAVRRKKQTSSYRIIITAKNYQVFRSYTKCG